MSELVMTAHVVVDNPDHNAETEDLLLLRLAEAIDKAGFPNVTCAVSSPEQATPDSGAAQDLASWELQAYADEGWAWVDELCDYLGIKDVFGIKDGKDQITKLRRIIASLLPYAEYPAECICTDMPCTCNIEQAQKDYHPAIEAAQAILSTVKEETDD